MRFSNRVSRNRPEKKGTPLAVERKEADSGEIEGELLHGEI